MMQPAENGPRLDTPKLLNSTVNGRILAQRQVRARRVVVVHIRQQQHVAQVPLAEHEPIRLCVPKTLSELMMQGNRLSWRDDRASLFRAGRPELAVQVEVAA
jgi:hypothetical protein